MKTDTKTNAQMFQISSDIFSYADVQEACDELGIAAEKPEKENRIGRMGLLSNPEVLIAIISAASTILVALIEAFVEIYKTNKEKGTIVIETEGATVKINADSSKSTIRELIEALGESPVIRQIFLLKD